MDIRKYIGREGYKKIYWQGWIEENLLVGMYRRKFICRDEQKKIYWQGCIEENILAGMNRGKNESYWGFKTILLQVGFFLIFSYCPSLDILFHYLKVYGMQVAKLFAFFKPITFDL